MSALTVNADRRRPRHWRDVNAWSACEAAPCGEAGALAWLHWWGNGGLELPAPDISDCLAVQPPDRPWLLTIWEPLDTKAPGPQLAHAYCCYISTIIFYGAPYVTWPYPRVYEGAGGRLTLNSGPSFLQWDQIESRFTWDDLLIYRGEIFKKGGGRVLWTHRPGERRRWWMRHGLRREREQ